MWVWSKRSAVSQEEVWEERFYENQNVVIRRLRSGKSLRVDLYCKRESDALDLMGQYGGIVRNLKEVDWVAESAKPVPPLKIRDSLLVTSETNRAKLRELQEIRGDRVVVIIPAEMAFGTGDHATTSSCLRFFLFNEFEKFKIQILKIQKNPTEILKIESFKMQDYKI